MSRSMLVAVLTAAATILGVLNPAQPADLLVSSRNSDQVRLAAGSPAIGAGQSSLFHGGAERVPPTDFDAEPRPEDLRAIGYDERP